MAMGPNGNQWEPMGPNGNQWAPMGLKPNLTREGFTIHIRGSLPRPPTNGGLAKHISGQIGAPSIFFPPKNAILLKQCASLIIDGFFPLL